MGLLGVSRGALRVDYVFLSYSIVDTLLNLKYSIVDILGMIVTKTPPEPLARAAAFFGCPVRFLVLLAGWKLTILQRGQPAILCSSLVVNPRTKATSLC